MKALIVVDMQADFINGSLAVPEGEDVIDPIVDRIKEGRWGVVIGTRDWHPDDHVSFADEPQFVDKSWPKHCVQNTPGAEIDPRIDQLLDVLVTKGFRRDTEAYSGFDGEDEEGLSLDRVLRMFKVDEVEIVGLATDYCVKATALDAVRHGYETWLWLPGTRAVNGRTGTLAVNDMALAGVRIDA